MAMQLNNPLYPLEWFPSRVSTRKVSARIIGKQGAAAGAMDPKTGVAYIPIEDSAFFRNVRRHEAMHAIYSTDAVDVTALGQALEDMRIHILGQDSINSLARADELVCALRDLRLIYKHKKDFAAMDERRIRVNLIPFVRALAIISFGLRSNGRNDMKRGEIVGKYIAELSALYEKKIGKSGLVAATFKAIEALKTSDDKQAARKALAPFMTLPKDKNQPTPQQPQTGEGQSQGKGKQTRKQSERPNIAPPPIGNEDEDEEDSNDENDESKDEEKNDSKKGNKSDEKKSSESESNDNDADSDRDEETEDESDSSNGNSESESDSESDESDNGIGDGDESDSDGDNNESGDVEDEEIGDDINVNDSDLVTDEPEKVTLGGVGGSGGLEDLMKKEVLTPESVSLLPLEAVQAMMEAGSKGSKIQEVMTINKLDFTMSKRITEGNNDKPCMAGAKVRANRLCNAVSPNPGRMFLRRGRRDGGTVLIDASGSMSLDCERLSRLAERLPIGTIAYYSGSGRYGWSGDGNDLVIYAENRRCYVPTDRRYLPKMHGGNECDFPAIQWLLKQGGPRYLVTDMEYCGNHNNVIDAMATILTNRAIERKLIKQFTTLGSLEIELGLTDKLDERDSMFEARNKIDVDIRRKACMQCGGKKILLANVASDLYLHHRDATPCPTCGGTGIDPKYRV